MTNRPILSLAIIVSATSICEIARSDDCSTHCKAGEPDCTRTSSTDDNPTRYCFGADGAVPDYATVGLKMLSDDEGWLTLTFRWSKEPAFQGQSAFEVYLRAVEFEMMLADSFLEPYDVQDTNPGVHFSSSLPCPYRDVYNHTAGNSFGITADLVAYCGFDPTDTTTSALATALWTAYNYAPENAHQFAVGSQCPEQIQPNTDYYLQYRVRKCRGSSCGRIESEPNIRTSSFVCIIQDGIPNYYCPLINGDSPDVLLGKVIATAGDPHPPLWLNRLCMPTGNFAFAPRFHNTCNSVDCGGHSTTCEDHDGDGYSLSNR